MSPIRFNLKKIDSSHIQLLKVKTTCCSKAPSSHPPWGSHAIAAIHVLLGVMHPVPADKGSGGLGPK